MVLNAVPVSEAGDAGIVTPVTTVGVMTEAKLLYGEIAVPLAALTR